MSVSLKLFAERGKINYCRIVYVNILAHECRSNHLRDFEKFFLADEV